MGVQRQEKEKIVDVILYFLFLSRSVATNEEEIILICAWYIFENYECQEQ